MRIPYVLVLALAVSATSLAGQQTPAAAPANPITTAFRTRIVALQHNLAQAFDSIPARLFSYKPTPPQMTVGDVAQHLASDNYFFCNTFGDMKATLAAKDTTTADSLKAKWPKDTLTAKLKASFTFCESALGQLDDARLADQVTLTFRGQSRQVPRASMALGHALDLEDHYSQIANYMRLNHMVPPTALPRPGGAPR